MSTLPLLQNYDISDYNKLVNTAYHDQTELFVMHANLSSLNANKKNLKSLLSKSNFRPDIIAISETRLNEDNSDNTEINGYYPFLSKNSVT